MVDQAPLSILLTSFLLVACASSTGDDIGRHDCNKTLCGCQTEDTKTVQVRYLDEESKPVWGVKLVCLGTGKMLGRTNPNGIIRLKIDGLTSPGCGFHADCATAYFVSKDQGIERPFWFRELLHEGSEIESGGGKATVLDVANED